VNRIILRQILKTRTYAQHRKSGGCSVASSLKVAHWCYLPVRSQDERVLMWRGVDA